MHFTVAIPAYNIYIPDSQHTTGLENLPLNSADYPTFRPGAAK
jgi:hypothetical protein